MSKRHKLVLILERGTHIQGSSLPHVMGGKVFSSSTHSVVEETLLRREWEDNHTLPIPVFVGNGELFLCRAYAKPRNKLNPVGRRQPGAGM